MVGATDVRTARPVPTVSVVDVLAQKPDVRHIMCTAGNATQYYRLHRFRTPRRWESAGAR